MRFFYIAANWKMNKSPGETERFVEDLHPILPREFHPHIVLFPPMVCLMAARRALSGLKMSWGAQNMHYEKKGAFTGETSPETLSHMGARFVLVGHSERRALFNESDAIVAKKFQMAIECGLTPLLCIGETLEERQKNQTESVLEKQLAAIGKFHPRCALAYEPVWAIGTGQVATPEQVQSAHTFIRQTLKKLSGPDLSENLSILYGGSVSTKNVETLIGLSEVDGFLIGGASLDPKEFSEITRVASRRFV